MSTDNKSLAVAGATIVAALAAIFFAPKSPNDDVGYRPERAIADSSTQYQVAFTGSMRPTFQGGEFYSIDPVSIDQVQVNDVVVVWWEKEQKNVLHRVFMVGTAGNGQRFLVTKGDNNPAPDPHIVTADDLVGRARFF